MRFEEKVLQCSAGVNLRWVVFALFFVAMPSSCYPIAFALRHV